MSEQNSAVYIQKRVQEIMDIMYLSHCQDILIPERPTLRGVEGGEIRRLSIALEILSMPPVLLLEDPILQLDKEQAVLVMSRLQILSDRGHTVVCSLPNTSNKILDHVDNLVLLSQGRSIYSGPSDEVKSYFTGY